MSYDATLKAHADRYLETNGPIGDKLAALYAETDVQLGIACAVARGVWHCTATKNIRDSVRLWRVEVVRAELRHSNAVRVLDPDDVLRLRSWKQSNWRKVSARVYLEAVRKLAKRVKA
jgi:hypothetical protein